MLDRAEDHFQYCLRFRQYLSVIEAQNPKPSGIQPGIAAFVFFPLDRIIDVLAAIQFNHQPGLGRIEIDDVLPQGALT